MNSLLNNIKIVDLSSVFMGPYCTMVLGDMGADVIKVEHPKGDTTRYIGPSMHEGMSSIFLNLNRNKRSITLDLKTQEGKNIIKQLIKESDVFVHSLRPQAIEKLNLTYEELYTVNSKIIYCGLYGFSKNGPYKKKPAYDDIIQASSGIASIQGEMAGEPQYLSSLMADKTTGLLGANAIIAALFHKERTGEGQEIEVPMFESMVSFSMIEHMYGHTFDPPIGDTVYPRAASQYRKPYKTKDGYISAMIYNDEHWRNFFDITGNAHLKNDYRFKNITARTNNIDFVYGKIEEIIKTKTTDEWLRLLENNDIPCARVNRPEDLFYDSHLTEVNHFQNVDHPTEGKIFNIKFPVNFSKYNNNIRKHAPNLGEHTEEILNEIKYNEIY